MALDIQKKRPESTVDLAEKGRSAEGEVISLDRRLFMQFMAFRGAGSSEKYIQALENAGFRSVLYENANDPTGIGLLTFAEDPDHFVREVRSLVQAAPFSELEYLPEFTMFGRTYAIGYEPDLERVLIDRPVERVTDPELRWAVWYPVRRSGAYENLPADEQRKILMEHGGIGRAYGQAKLAYDIRLACYGLDKYDNDFVIGLLGHDLHPLSAIVERMRKTKQTSQYLTNLGPFFVGRVVWQKK